LQIRVGVLEAGPRKNPVKIRMGQDRGVATTGAVSAGRVFLAAQELLGDPDRQSLLSNAARPLKKDARREPSRADAGQELLAELFVAKKFDDCHIEIWSP